MNYLFGKVILKFRTRAEISSFRKLANRVSEIEDMIRNNRKDLEIAAFEVKKAESFLSDLKIETFPRLEKREKQLAEAKKALYAQIDKRLVKIK